MKKIKLLSSVPSLVKNLFKQTDIVGYVEWIDANNIYGWVISKKGIRPHLKCTIDDQERQIYTKWVERTDVASQYGNKYTHSGFQISLADPTLTLDEIIANDKIIKTFANNILLKNIADEQSQMSAAVSRILATDRTDPLTKESAKRKASLLELKQEKLEISYEGTDFTAEIDSWGGFTLHGATNLEDDVLVELFCNDKQLECAVLWKELTDETVEDDSVERHFEIEIPGYVWEESSSKALCRLEVHLNKENITLTPLELSSAKALSWIADIVKMPEGQGKQYRALLVLEHIRYGKLLERLSAKEIDFIHTFAERMQLTDFVFTDEAPLAVTKVPTESIVTLSLWKALRVLNSRISSGQALVFEDVKKTIQIQKLKGKARDRFLFSVTPTLCNTGEFLRLREFSDFSALKKLANSHDLWEMTLAIPALMSEERIAEATNLVYKAVNNLGGSWLNTECICYAVELSRQIEAEGEIEIGEVEKFRYSVIALLDAFYGEWFSRLHDQKLIDSMVLILSDLDRYTDYHRRDVVTAAQRIYGLNPAFWETVAEQNIPQLDSELARSHAYFKKIHAALTGKQSSIIDLLETIAEPLAYFRAKNNPEAVIFLREILANHLGELNESLPTRGRALLSKLLASEPAEALRIAAFPLATSNRLIDQFPETEPKTLCETLRNLSAAYRSVALHLQEKASTGLSQLLIAHEQQDSKSVEKALAILEQDAILLNNWQGGFLAFDLLSSAYAISDLHGLDGSALFDRMLFILEKVSKETKADWFLSAPVLSGLMRLSQFEANKNAVLESFISECRSLISWKFGESMDALFTPVVQPQMQIASLGWPQDTLVVIYSCRKYLDTRVEAIRQTWVQDLKARNIPYLVVVGDGDDSIEGDVLALEVSDLYEDLPKKTLKLFDWVYHNTDAQYVLKIDDDCYLDVERFFNTLSYRKHFYYGRVIIRGVGSMDRAWHQSKSHSDHGKKSIDKSPEPSTYADGGGAYTLSRLAILKLLEAEKTLAGERLIACSFMEDKLVGDLLALSFIEPSNEDYESYQRRRTFAEAMPVAMWENTFFPCQATPTKVTHLDTAHDFEPTRAKADSKELWPKKLWPTCWHPAIQLNRNQLELLTDASVSDALLKQHELVVIAVVRNEIIMLPHFLAHYRQLGVQSFIFVDNCSDDGSREYLYQQTDVVLYSADTDYKFSHYGVAWQQAVLGNLCLGKWVLVADADELFVFPECENRLLTDFITELEEEGCNAACTYMIDMYPKGELSEADFTEHSPFEVAAWFDNPPVTPWRLGSGWFSNSLSTGSHLRHRVVPDAVPHDFVSQKYALFRYAPWVRVSQGLHYASNLKVSSQATWFAHFKYHAGFKEKVETEIYRGQHFNNAAEYRRYLAMLNESKGGFYQEAISVRYKTSTDFLTSGNFGN